MRIFVASSFLNKKETQRVQALLKEAGHEITHDWTQFENPGEDLYEYRYQSVQDTRGVMSADVLVVVWPGRWGTATEVGIAIALDIPVIIIGDCDRKCNVYWNHPNVHVVSRVEIAIMMVNLYDTVARIKADKERLARSIEDTSWFNNPLQGMRKSN